MLKILFFAILISFSLSQNLDQYTKRTKNCEVGDKNIKIRVEMITKSSKNNREKAEKIFTFVRDNIQYTNYINTKYGAIRTLKNRAGNCCDQTHLLIALLRTAGIPSRYRKGDCYFVRAKKVIRHVWAEANIDNKWITLDTTHSINVFGIANNWSTAKNLQTFIELPS